MRNIKFISIFILLCGFTFALVQCAKEEIDTNTVDTKIESRSSNPCAPKIMCPIEYKIVDIQVPGYSGCTIQAEMIYEKCGEKFRFFDFIMIIPNSTGCAGLRNYLDGLTPDQLRAFMDWVEAEGKRLVLQLFYNQLPYYVDVTSYHSLCKQECKWLDLDCLIDEYTGGPRGGGGINPRGDKECWKYGTVRCGEGCCVTESQYVKNIQGQFVLYSAVTTPYGPCDSGPVPNWPHFIRPFGLNGSPTTPCKFRCN